jgi:hypothetical protein
LSTTTAIRRRRHDADRHEDAEALLADRAAVIHLQQTAAVMQL